MVVLYEPEIESILAALRNLPEDWPVEGKTKLEEALQTREDFVAEAYRSAAQEEWTQGGIDWDNYPYVSDSEDGAWVNAWLWVRREELGLQECERCEGFLPPGHHDTHCDVCLEELEKQDED